jgi:hypothetical protein
MFDNAHLLDLIEHALDTDPFCPACGEPTTIKDDDGRLWLVCTATLDPVGVGARISAVILPHLRYLVVDLSEHLAA